MNVPITYIPGFVEAPNDVFAALWNELAWERRDLLPRREYYSNDFSEPYTYGEGLGARTYEAKPYHEKMLELRRKLEALTSASFEACFLNGYENQSDFLGWHADDSDELDDSRPIGIISLGAEREIWFAPKDNMKDVTKVLLQNGSLCLMHPGMQITHKHRIPKASFMCGERISLTFRGYLK